MRKYELTEDFIEVNNIKLFRIKATEDFNGVVKGELGGYIRSTENLSGNAWVYGNAKVYGDARVFGNAKVYGDAIVYGDAWISCNTWVYGSARVYGDTWISGYAWVYGNAKVYGDARVFGNAKVYGDARVFGNARVYGDARVFGDARVYGDASVYGDADYCVFQSFGSENRNTTFFKTKNKSIGVSCGCFKGTLKEFEERVKQTHKENKHAKEYLAIIEVVKIKFEIK